ncbi:ankyrin repeat-containing domain protein [Aspergillus californicus]
MLAAAWNNNVELLQLFREHYPNTDWQKKFQLRPDNFHENSSCIILKESEIPECSALHIAAAAGAVQSLIYLIKENLVSDINAKAGLGYTCAHFAAAQNMSTGLDILQYLKTKSCNINALDDLQETPLDIAIRCGMPAPDIKSFVDMGAKHGNATRNEDEIEVNNVELLENDILPRLYNKKLLAKQRLRLLAKAIESGDLSACKWLQSQGCPLSDPLPGRIGIPLMWALSQKRPGMVRWLLRNGGGESAVHPKCRYME